MNVLVVTKSDDHDGVRLTIDAIERLGARAVRFDTDRFPTETRLSLEYGPDGDRLIFDGPDGAIDLMQLTAVYYRRVAYGRGLPEELDRQLRSASVGEIRATVEGLLHALPVFQLDPIWNVRRASNKQLQARLAREVGLEIPRTLTSNDPDAVRRFAASCPGGMIAKMLSSFAVYREGVEEVVFTNEVQAADLDDLDGLELCPMTFQELLPKRLEYRVTVVGDRVFSSAVDSQASETARIDWRRDGRALSGAWWPEPLPRPVEERLLRLVDALGLQYGAADFIRTPDDRFLFLEVNPVGEYFWLDGQHGGGISQSLAEVLVGKGRRRSGDAG
jgi:glutathione synthase/RimK-type ligase-like ATP-grasp enzyme